MAVLRLSVTGMTCEHCRQKVEDALKGVTGTFGAAVFLDEAEAEVDFDAARASPDALVAAVAAAGYRASVVE